MRLNLWALACALPLMGQGVITTIAGGDYAFPDDGAAALNAALATPRGLALDTHGNLLIAAADLNQVLMLTTDRVIHVVAGTGIPGFAGDGASARFAELQGPMAVAVDSAGVIYVADTGNNRIRRITADGIISTYAGTGAYSNSVVEGTLASSTAMQPRCLAFDAQGNLLVGDSAASRLRRIDRLSLAVTTVAGNGQPFSSNFNAPPAPALSVPLNGFPFAVAADGNGNIYFTDADELKRVDRSGTLTVIESPTLGTSFVVAVAPDGSVVLGGNGPILQRVQPNGTVTTLVRSDYGFAGDQGPVSKALLSVPWGMAIDSAGKIFFSDTYNDRIRTVDPDGTINTIAGKGRFTGDGGPATRARLVEPAGVVVKPDGSVYIFDRGDYRIRRIAPDGTISTFAGTGIPGIYNGATQVATQLNLFFSAMADDPVSGGVLVADFSRVFRIGAAGQVQLVAGSGSQSDSGDGGQATRAGLFPRSLFEDTKGNVYVGESSRVRKVDLNGIITTIAGSGTAGFSGDSGLAIDALLNFVAAIAVDTAGNVYIGDTNNSRVRRIDASGMINTVASLPFPSALEFDAGGSLYAQSAGKIAKLDGGVTSYLAPRGGPFFGDGGFAKEAGFTLNGFTFDKSGNVYIADYANQRVRLVLAGPPAFIALTQRSLTFQAGGNAPPAPQSFTVLFVSPSAGASPLNWTATATTISGGNWLQLATSGATVQVSVNAAGLAPGSYYGQIDVRALGAPNSPESVTVALNVGASGPAPPSVASGGVLNAASFQPTSPLAPGSLISIFGQALADAPAQAGALPLPTRLGATSVTLGGRPLPLLYVNSGQINAMIPFDVPIDTTLALIVQRGTALSSPEMVSIAAGQPAVFTQDASGSGAAVVTAVHPDGSQNLVTSDAPARAGDVLVIYCTGLGSVGARVLAGQASPATPPAYVVGSVGVMIGGLDAPPFFAGLTPGFTGLYQINVTLPQGLSPGNAPLRVIMPGAVVSPTVLVPVQ